MATRKRIRREAKQAGTNRTMPRQPEREPEPVASPAQPQVEADEFDVGELPAESHPEEPDPRVVDSVTDRIFASVLSRYGWEKHNGRIEHVGEERRR